MTNTSANEIVESYQAALGQGDFATARTLMQDDMTFQGPFDTFNTADDYLESLRRLASIIQRIDLKKVFVDGDDVCVLYEMVTNTPPEQLSSPSGTRSRAARSQPCALCSMRVPSRPCSAGEDFWQPTGPYTTIDAVMDERKRSGRSEGLGNLRSTSSSLSQ